MADILADEHIDPRICADLRLLGHRVETVRSYSSSKSGDGWSDEEVLKFAIDHKFSVLTANESDFCQLAKKYGWHYGLIIINPDHPPRETAKRIDSAVRDNSPIRSKIIKLTTPPKKRKSRGLKNP